MRTHSLLCALGLALLNAGCGIYEYTTINVVVSTGRVVNEWKTRAYYRCQADKAWAEIRRSCPGERFSTDYAKGFKRGYVETIDRDGTPVPPCMPPYCYRSWHYESPAGHEAITEWFDGYRHGAVVAANSGYRDSVVVPLAVPGRDKMPNPFPGPGDMGPSGAEDLAPPATLPMPRESIPADPVPVAPPPGAKSAGAGNRLPPPEQTKTVPALSVPASRTGR